MFGVIKKVWNMAREKLTGIYKIQSKIHPDRCYIGSALDIKSRWSKHKSWMKNQKGKNRILLEHYNKYGWDAFDFSIVALCNRDDLIPDENGIIWIEQCFIMAYRYKETKKPYFNICEFAGSTINRSSSEETKQKLRDINTGKTMPQETKDKIGSALRGQKRPPFSDEWIKNLSLSKSGENHPCWGKSSPAKGKDPWNKGKTGVYTEQTILKMKKPKSDEHKKHTKESWIKRKEEGKVGIRDDKGRFKKGDKLDS